MRWRTVGMDSPGKSTAWASRLQDDRQAVDRSVAQPGWLPTGSVQGMNTSRAPAPGLGLAL
ncbi:MAG: hypothetical protein H7836_12040 [Magnetococcus sp. YQC-3]